jgi:hypothetical protein
VNLGIVALKVWLTRNGSSDHFQPSFRWGRSGVQLEGGKTCRNEDHTIERQLLQRLAREEKMAVMNWVEAAAVKRSTHAREM